MAATVDTPIMNPLPLDKGKEEVDTPIITRQVEIAATKLTKLEVESKIEIGKAFVTRYRPDFLGSIEKALRKCKDTEPVLEQLDTDELLIHSLVYEGGWIITFTVGDLKCYLDEATNTCMHGDDAEEYFIGMEMCYTQELGETNKKKVLLKSMGLW